ncbi:MAG: STAS domain-containing protein [Acidimicrobiales bacterium]
MGVGMRYVQEIIVESGSGEAVTVQGSMDDPRFPVIRIGGELDLSSVESVKLGMEPYLRDETTRVTFDLEELTFMDSSGIALLVQVANRVESVELRNVTPIVRRVLQATGLLEAFGLAP